MTLHWSPLWFSTSSLVAFELASSRACLTIDAAHSFEFAEALATLSRNSLYAKTLPRFRTALLFALLHQVSGLIIYFPLLFITTKPVIIALASLGMALDILFRLVKVAPKYILSLI